MCDYSLHAVASRPAKVGDKLVTTDFANSITRGLTAVGEPHVAVSLLPGTEVAFDRDVEYEHFLGWFRKPSVREKVARFRQLNMGNPHTHHDAFEFPGGKTVLVTRLIENQTLTVLQLPAVNHTQGEKKGAVRGNPAPTSIDA
jgi:hypothetical protein